MHRKRSMSYEVYSLTADDSFNNRASSNETAEHISTLIRTNERLVETNGLLVAKIRHLERELTDQKSSAERLSNRDRRSVRERRISREPHTSTMLSALRISTAAIEHDDGFGTGENAETEENMTGLDNSSPADWGTPPVPRTPDTWGDRLFGISSKRNSPSIYKESSKHGANEFSAAFSSLDDEPTITCPVDDNPPPDDGDTFRQAVHDQVTEISKKLRGHSERGDVGDLEECEGPAVAPSVLLAATTNDTGLPLNRRTNRRRSSIAAAHQAAQIIAAKPKAGQATLGQGGKRGWPWVRSILISGLLAFLGIGALSLVYWGTDQNSMTLILGSFGAEAVLLYAAPYSPFSQPRNVIGGHAIAILVGMFCQQCVMYEVAIPLSVSLCIMVQMALDMIHPPGGGAVLIAVIAGKKVQDLGWLYAVPVFVSVVLMLVVATLNNAFVCVSTKRKYPSGGMRKFVYW